MELMVEESLQRSEIEKPNELEKEENKIVEESTEEKHGVGCKIINTSNDNYNDSFSKLNNGLVNEFDRKASSKEKVDKFEHTTQEKNQAVADKEDIATSAVSKDDKTTTIKEHLENNDENHLENQPVEGEKVNDLIEIEVNKNIEKVDESVKNEENEDNGKNEEAMIESDNQEGSFEIKSDSYNIEMKNKKENKDDDLKLFDDADLPLKGTKRDGRGRKKKSQESASDGWDRVGIISGKIFDEEDDDDAYDYHNHYDYEADENDEYTSFKQASMAKKGGSGEKLGLDVSKKSKVDPFSRKFIKTPIAASEKKKPVEATKPRKSGKNKTLLQRKETWLRGWEKKMRGVENELEGRVRWVLKSEGRIMREERRLAEKEALLGYREQLLLNVPLDNDEGIKKVLEEATDRLKLYAGWIDDQSRDFDKRGEDNEDDGQLSGCAKAIETLPFSDVGADVDVK